MVFIIIGGQRRNLYIEWCDKTRKDAPYNFVHYKSHMEWLVLNQILFGGLCRSQKTTSLSFIYLQLTYNVVAECNIPYTKVHHWIWFWATYIHPTPHPHNSSKMHLNVILPYIIYKSSLILKSITSNIKYNMTRKYGFTYYTMSHLYKTG
jgi:hypothetical protein